MNTVGQSLHLKREESGMDSLGLALSCYYMNY